MEPQLTLSENGRTDQEWLSTLPKYVLPEGARTLTLHEQFHAQAYRAPDRVAVADDHRSLTYEQLNRRVLSLGEHLRSEFNVGLDVKVGIYMEPSVNYVLSLMAIMSAGGAYVTIEAAYPQNMIEAVCKDAEMKVILTTQKMSKRFQAVDGVALLVVDQDEDGRDAILSLGTSKLSTEELDRRRICAPRPTLENLAFVVYSSGTTGRPKGIANPHRAPVLSYQWRWCLSPCLEGDRVACNVFFIWEAMRPLLLGATTYCVRPDQIYDGPQLAGFVQRNSITEILFTPTLLQNLITNLPVEQLMDKMSSLKTCYLNGEVLSKDLARRAIAVLPNVRFINLYSISECHEVSATDLLNIDLNDPPTGFCPVGYPSPLTPPLIVGEDGNLVEEGEPGELYVGGPLLAREYLNMKKQTKERFPLNRFADSETGRKCRIYRTGDRARILPNGMLEILGRCAFMVKIRGYSVVLGAIEQALLDSVTLRACSVIADGGEGTEKRLVAFLVKPNADSESDGEKDERGELKLQEFVTDARTGLCPSVQKRLSTRLPHYMVPSVYIELDCLPLHPVSGKLDNKRLAELAAEQRLSLIVGSSVGGKFLMGLRHNPQGNDKTSAVRKQREVALKHSYKYMRIPEGASIGEVEHGILCCWEGILDLPFGSVSLDDDFISLGGQSLSAARLIAAIDKMFGIRLPVIDVLEGVRAKDQAISIVNKWQDNGGAGNKVKTGAKALVQRVLKESVVSPVGPAETSSAAEPTPLKDCTQVFLTGATGYFGAFLLAEMLHAGVKSIVCLVRKRDGKTGIQVLEQNLNRYGLLRPLGGLISRVHPVHGDLTKPFFGLLEKLYNNVLMSSDGIVHCAAAVSLGATFDSLKAVNMEGTREIVSLASRIKSSRGVVPRGVFISTNGIFALKRVQDGDAPVPADCDFDALLDAMVYNNRENDTISEMCNGYGLTKWGAEKMIHQANEEMGLSFVTYRMGNIGWHSKTGDFNDLDFQGMIFRGCNTTAAVPVVPDWKIELTPVDWAASKIVEIASTQTTETFHIVQPEPVPWAKVIDWMDEIRREENKRPLKRVSWDEWRELAAKATKGTKDGNKLLALVDALPGGGIEYLSSQPYLQCSPNCQAHGKEEYLSRDSLKLFFSRVSRKKYSLEPKIVGCGTNASSTRPLEGKIAVVTGASSGIGRAICVELAKAGCSVTLAARRMQQLEETESAIDSACTQGSVKTLCVPTDVTDRQAVVNLVSTAEESLGPVDIFVNCAGVMYFTLMKNIMWDDWERTVDVNCKGTMYGVGAVLPQMIRKGQGHIINITSDAGRKAFAGLGVYSGSKFFVEGMSQALRLETADTGVRVTCIQPGNVATPLLATSTDAEGMKAYGEPSGAKVLDPEDVGRAVVYAASQPEWCAVNEILVEPRQEPA